MKKLKTITSVLIVIAIVLVIISAAIQIYNYLQPTFSPESNQLNINGIWKYIVFVFPIVDIVLAGILRIVELKKERKSLDSDLVFTEELSKYIEKKDEVLCNLTPSAYPEEVLRQSLMLTADCLKRYIGRKYYFELSIFTNSNTPLIYAYYDTHGNNKPSSYTRRSKNPRYYIEKKYEVVELLSNPSSKIFIIPSTKEYNYNFIDNKQKKQIGTQIMYCFHMENPYVLVITCNKSNVFKETDYVLKSFIQNIGRILNSDILIKENLCCRHSFHCCNNKNGVNTAV